MNLDHATSEIASGSKLGIDATKRIPGDGFDRRRPLAVKILVLTHFAGYMRASSLSVVCFAT